MMHTRREKERIVKPVIFHQGSQVLPAPAEFSDPIDFGTLPALTLEHPF